MARAGIILNGGRSFDCYGALGDTYLILMYLKLLGNYPITVKHYYCVPHYFPSIRELYGLLPNVVVEEVGHDNFDDPVILRRMGHKIKSSLMLNYDLPTKLDRDHPEWNLPTYDGLPDNYSVLATRSGNHLAKNNTARAMLPTEIERCVRAAKYPVVLVGDKHAVAAKGTIDLRGKTTLTEALGIVSRAKQFFGSQGLLCFVAMSQKVPSVIYVQGEKSFMPVRTRMFRKWYRYCDDIRTRQGQ
jgi:hypothetical protein